MTSIYLACKLEYEYSDHYYDECYIQTSCTPLAAFTFFELAQEYVDELNLKHYRNVSVRFMDYAPVEGSKLFLQNLQSVQQKYELNFDFYNSDSISKALNQLTDEQLIKFISEINLPFYDVRGIPLYA